MFIVLRNNISNELIVYLLFSFQHYGQICNKKTTSTAKFISYSRFIFLLLTNPLEKNPTAANVAIVFWFRVAHYKCCHCLRYAYLMLLEFMVDRILYIYKIIIIQKMRWILHFNIKLQS